MHRRLSANLLFGLIWLFVVPIGAYAACPDLSAFYPASDDQWEAVRARLTGEFEECLLSSEYFALYGAAQLNTGLLNESIESLERALLLDPDNGAAMIDYAQALLQDGQIFAALEANEMVLSREDIPQQLVTQVVERQQNWQSLTRQTSWQLDVLGGFDDNLNGAPDQDLITLTPSGEPILLALDESFQASSGPYLNLRAQGRHRRLAPQAQHNISLEMRGRLSEDSASDLAQLAGRYTLVRSQRRADWQLNTGINHLLLAGNPIFTGTDTSFRFQPRRAAGACKPYYGAAFQHQLWHNQSRLNGIESKLGVGNNCSLSGMNGQRINAEVSLLHNAELKSNRLGGDRQGWQLSVDWQYALPSGFLNAQYSYTSLLDSRGYSPLLSNNARRDINRNAFLLQYRANLSVLGRNTQFLLNVYHQDQNSNIELFQTEDTSAEIGIRLAF